MRKTLEKASKIATLSPREIAKIRARIQQTVTNAQKDIDLVLIGAADLLQGHRTVLSLKQMTNKKFILSSATK